ncbi:DUF4238 domain-containing protein [Dinghuibacter silviterrae]|uniref:Uncharacterized protein DUF4238 n=1 Tax=Dinghuibacter silviterrae TaxID=1539049 RepID=A0A4R8DIL2_9BACT|nr:DUF4238 domain-containing protein [Dinghuibacter silviterrae]TDW97144.1 uncharacterized protein DUF4238 [Dinghuibacter silviterrae]
MLLPTRQTALLKILFRFQDDISIEVEDLTAIYVFLFSDKPVYLTLQQPSLRAVVETLKEVVDTHHMTSLGQISDYFDQQKLLLSDFLSEVQAEIDINRKWANDHLTYSSLKEGIVKRLFIPSSTYFSIAQEKGDLFNELYSAQQDAYTHFFGRYLHQFAEYDHVFVLLDACHSQISFKNLNEVVGQVKKLSQMDCYADPMEVSMNNNIMGIYDKLLELIAEERPLSDMKFKLGLTTWLCHIKCDYREDSSSSNELYSYAWDHYNFYEEVSVFYYRILADKKWSILKSPKNLSWLTSDNPGFVVEKDDSGTVKVETNHIWDRMQSKIARFYYPLSKEYCLRIESESFVKQSEMDVPIEFVDCSENEWQEINEQTIQVSKEMVISSDRKMLELFTDIIG